MQTEIQTTTVVLPLCCDLHNDGDHLIRIDVSSWYSMHPYAVICAGCYHILPIQLTTVDLYLTSQRTVIIPFSEIPLLETFSRKS